MEFSAVKEALSFLTVLFFFVLSKSYPLHIVNVLYLKIATVQCTGQQFAEYQTFKS